MPRGQEDCNFCPSFFIISATYGSSNSRSTSPPYNWKASMQRLCTRWQGSSNPTRNSGKNSAAELSDVTASEWSSANCASALQAVWRTRGLLAFSCALTAPTMCSTVASSSTNSAIVARMAKPATVCFQAPAWNKVAIAGFKVSMTAGNFSPMHLLTRSMTSLPFSKLSSSSASSSSSWPHSSRSSDSFMRKCTQTSNVCCTYPGTFEIALGLPSSREHNTSSAKRCVSSDW
mmetsp:Transcript_46034/g.139570  ORF Transcript_46034/g.139570 Transcript_46034/m.139570 type:complete len:232 (-) Transcript_46034:894-1589(-)